jgi:uncharacterized spore protein YtfJ
MVPVEGGARPRLFQTRTIQGAPYEVAGQVLVPVVRVVSMGKARGTVGMNSVSGWAWAFARIMPVAILVRTETGDRRITIVDTTAKMIGVLMAAALISTLFLAVLRRVAGRF